MRRACGRLGPLPGAFGRDCSWARPGPGPLARPHRHRMTIGYRAAPEAEQSTEQLRECAVSGRFLIEPEATDRHFLHRKLMAWLNPLPEAVIQGHCDLEFG